ncbi:putative nuclease HARBI1 [Mycetomoellerius zeteki]|nr:PREDICTED: putative nuclease HARBI1 [Trachymyrmex zeteki]
MAGKILLLDELIDSSSSSSDEEITAIVMKCTETDRIPKIKNMMEIINEYSDREFQRHFRLKRSTFDQLNTMYSNSEIFNSLKEHGGWEVISSDRQLLSFLWYAGNKCVIRDVASRFNVAESTFHSIVSNVIKYLNNIAPNIIKMPDTEERKRLVAHEFENICGFPGVLGCIDGTYIKIRTPAKKIKSTYVNRHDYPSLTLQAVCDAHKLFLDVFTGPPSKIHDARIFQLSFFSDEIQNISNDYHILGDAAYPLQKYLLTPYRDYGNLTAAQQNYNHKLSTTRVKIENTFALLKQRFRQLMTLEFITVKRSSNFIISCCVLHNSCIMNDDYLNEDIDDVEYNDVERHIYNEQNQNDRIQAASPLQPQQLQQEMTTKLVTSLLSRSTATACYDDFWNGVDSAASAAKQFWNTAEVR